MLLMPCLRRTLLFLLALTAVSAAVALLIARFGLPGLSPPGAVRRGRYVSLCPARINGNHRAGNHLFMLAAMLYVAERTNRTVIMSNRTKWRLDDVFDVSSVVRVDVPQSSFADINPPEIYNGDPLFDDDQALEKLAGHTTLGLCGLYQTYRYADALGPTLRRVLRIKPDALREAQQFLELNRPANWSTGSFARVGVQVRRGDFLSNREQQYGLTVVTDEYLDHSMNYFRSRHSRVQFVVATDDLKWTWNAVLRVFDVEKVTEASLEAYRLLPVGNGSTFVTFSVGHSTAVDLAILTACDASIISTGSYSWWAGWLTDKTTVYYADWPRPGSSFDSELDHAAYFPPRWIPMT